MDIQFFMIGFWTKEKKWHRDDIGMCLANEIFWRHTRLHATRHEWLNLFSSRHECFTSDSGLTRTRLVSCVLLTSLMFGWRGCYRGFREVKRIHKTRRVRVRPTSLVKHSWRVEKRLSHWWRVADECDVKKMAHGRLPGSASNCNCKSAESRSWSIRFASFSGFTVISIWWVSSKGKWKSKKTEQWSGSVLHLPNSHCHSFLLKKSTPWQNPRCPKSKFVAVERDKVLPRCPKSTLSKIRRCQKKSLNLAGIWLDRACESETLDSSGRVPWPGRIETRARHVPGPVTGIWLVSFRTFS